METISSSCRVSSIEYKWEMSKPLNNYNREWQSKVVVYQKYKPLKPAVPAVWAESNAGPSPGTYL